MEKIQLQRINRKTGETEEITVYDSLSDKRIDDESREEYLNRRAFIKQLEKTRKDRLNYVHVSSTLIPLKTNDGKVMIVDNKPIWIGKTKGETYIKQVENEE
jgi:hypothetical protein